MQLSVLSMVITAITIMNCVLRVAVIEALTKERPGADASGGPKERAQFSE